jgi:hypothetical protein
MDKPASLPPAATQDWRLLVEAAILETNPDDLSQRIQDAQDAIMDHIEDSFQTATQSERQSMINAMNSLRELRRLFQTPGWKMGARIGELSDA